MPLITPADLARVAPHAAAHIAAAIVDHAEDVLPRYGLATAERLPDFLAHVLVESAYGTTCAENLNYSAERAHAVWPSHFPTVASAGPYAHNPEALADLVYGGRMGNTGPHDGWLFRGQGLLMTTGRAGVGRLAAELGKTLEETLLLLTSPKGMLECAAANYVLLGAPAHADRGDIVATTRCVNGGLNGLADRRAALALCRKVWPRVPRAAALPASVPASKAASAPPPAAPSIPPQTKENPVPQAKLPLFVTAFMALFGFGSAQASPIGDTFVPGAGGLAFVIVLCIGLAWALRRALPRLRFVDGLKLAAILLGILLAGASAAHAATVDLTSVAQASVDDFFVPVLKAGGTAAAGLLGVALHRYFYEDASSKMAGRFNDILDKAINVGARNAKAAIAAKGPHVDVDGVLATAAANYAIATAPRLMKRAAGVAGDKLQDEIEKRVVARLDDHPAYLALQATAAGQLVGAPLQLAGAAA